LLALVEGVGPGLVVELDGLAARVEVADLGLVDVVAVRDAGAEIRSRGESR